MSTRQYVYQVPTGYRQQPGSHWPCIISVIILLLVIIGLVIWLIIRYTRDSNGNDKNDFSLSSAKIRSSGTTISGSWTATNSDEEFTATLYVSEDPLVFQSDGTIVCDHTTVLCDEETATKGTLNITTGIKANASYNAAMIFTKDGVDNYRIIGPQKVFTQTGATLVNQPVTFQIRDLDDCVGAVSNTSTYTVSPANIGNYRYGRIFIDEINSTMDGYLIKYEDDDPTQITDPTMILCRKPNSLDVVLAEWDGSDNNIHLPNETATISPNNCLWTYNESPPNGAGGENKWCLDTPQSTSLTNSTTNNNLCLSRGGTSSLVLANISSSGATTANSWFNQVYPTTVGIL